MGKGKVVKQKNHQNRFIVHRKLPLYIITCSPWCILHLVCKWRCDNDWMLRCR